MRHDRGAYFAAMDADIDGEEGVYYVWKAEELKEVVKDDYPVFSDYYGITPTEVWENNKYVLAKAPGFTKGEFAKQNGTMAAFNAKLTKWNKLLLKQRQKRKAPRKDDKIICSWNALLASGYVEAYKTFGQQDYLIKARETVGFLMEYLVQNGQLGHSYKKNSKFQPGFLEDYAFLTRALIDLYSVTMDQVYLDKALQLSQMVQDHFADAQSAMFRYHNSADLISQIVKTDDGVIPSGNSIMAKNLFRLAQLYHDNKMLQSSKDMLSLMTSKIKESTGNYGHWSSLFLDNLHAYFQIAVVGENAKNIMDDLHRLQIENAIIVGSNSESDLPMFKNRLVKGDTFIYVCQNNSCKMPVTNVAEAVQQIRNYN